MKYSIYCIVKNIEEAKTMANQFARLGKTESDVSFYEELPVPAEYTAHIDPGSYDEGELRTLYNHLQILDLAFNEEKVERAIISTGAVNLSKFFFEKFDRLEFTSCAVLGYHAFRQDVWQFLQERFLSSPHTQVPDSVHPEIVRGVQIYSVDAEYGRYLIENYKKPFYNYTGPRNLDLLTLYSAGRGGCLAYPPLALTPLLNVEDILADRGEYF